MYISQIALRDWKSYTTAIFEFPAPEAGKNIALIGAPNGYGKTSFFEAIVLGMFGRDGLPLIARSPFSSGDNERLATSYKHFLEKALHRGAVSESRNSCSVKLTFIDDDGQRIEVQRIWHFSNEGVYRPADEEVNILEGATRKPIGPKGLAGLDRSEWYRDYIARTFLPYYLAAFFLFDGEQVSAFAEREMAAQVRHGIEGLLGLPILRTLAEDLRAYAAIRRRESTNVSDKKIEKIEKERDRIKEQITNFERRLEEIEPDLHKLKAERDNLIREVASYGVGSQAELQERLEQLDRYRRMVEDSQAQLEKLLAEDMALAVAGKSLRKRVVHQLEAETITERWESGKRQGDSNLDKYLGAVSAGIADISPELTKTQHTCVLETARGAWENLWNPPPENCVKEYAHPYLNELERAKVIDRLVELDELGAPAITELLNSIEVDETELIRLQEELTRTEAIAPEIEEKRQRLGTLHEQIQGLDQEVGGIRREREALEGQLNQKNAELTKMSGQWDQAKPSIRRATRALKVSSVVDKIVSDAVPSQINAIAAAMTKAHRSMAHKKDMVERIEINESCDVKLLDAQGIDVRRYDLSAGEKQIFTQALISAVSSVSGREFPMVVDTPLGRLDIDHRKGILKHLAKRDGQVILLSTNTEVVGEYLDEIRNHVQKKYRVSFERIGDIGRSKVNLGYFGDEETVE